MTGFKILFRINAAVDDPIGGLSGIPANPPSSLEQVLYRPSLHLHHVLVIGRHVIGDTVKQGFIAASNMEGNAFMLVIDLHRFVVKLNSHLASHVLVRDSVIMLVIRKLYSVVLLYGYLFALS